MKVIENWIFLEKKSSIFLTLLLLYNLQPNPFVQIQICLLTKRKIGNWHIYGQAYHLMLKTAMIFLKSSGEDWQLAAIPKISHLWSPVYCKILKLFESWIFFIKQVFKMIPPFSRDEVRRHLIDLGYKNVTEEKLDLFVKDLSRLVKYEEKRAKKKDKKRKYDPSLSMTWILIVWTNYVIILRLVNVKNKWSSAIKCCPWLNTC